MTNDSSTKCDLQVISVGTIPRAMKDIARLYTASTSQGVVFLFGNPLLTLQRLRRGEEADVVIYSPRIEGDLIKEQFVPATGGLVFAKSRIGIGVAADKPIPEFKTKGDFVLAMRVAATIGLLDPAAGSGTSPPVFEAFETLGLMSELAPKIRLFQGTGEQIGEAIARRDVEIGFTAVSELTGIDGVKVVGPIPSDVVSYVSFVCAAESSSTKNKKCAEEFIRFLKLPQAQEILLHFGVNL